MSNSGLRPLILVGALLLAGLGIYRYLSTPSEPPLPVLFQAPDFELKNSRGETATKADLRGKIWLAGFIFTRCPGPCPLMTAAMRNIQETLADEELIEREIPFRLVSITVDPEHDSPEKLAQYADAHGADRDSWMFLTGPNTRQLAAEGFKIAVGLDPELQNDPPLVHGTRFLLIGPDGNVRALYDFREKDLST